MRRILLVLSVAALMAAMMVAMAMPAFAKNFESPGAGGPPDGSGGYEKGGTFVLHCNSDALGGKSVTVFLDSDAHGNCRYE